MKRVRGTTMHSEDPPRWLDEGGGDASSPAGLGALVAADAVGDADPERLGRIADGIAERLGRPELAASMRGELSGPATSAGAGTSAGLGKLLAGAGLAALGLAAWLGVRATLEGEVPPPAPQPQPRPSAPPPASPPAPAIEARAHAEPTTPESSDQTPATTLSRRDKPSPATDKPSREREVDAAAELALLERAQRALGSQPRRALSLAREHRVRFGHGSFVQEREMIAIEALLQLGRRAAAGQRGRRFLRTYPHSSHVPRLHELLEAADNARPAGR